MGKNNFFSLMLIGVGIWGSFSSSVFASESTTKFFINGRELLNAEIVLKMDTTYVPLRIVSEELGAQVSYDAKNKDIVVKKGNTSLEITLNQKDALLNGNPLILSNAPLLHTTADAKQLTYVPLRTIFETFNAPVTYNKEYNFVNAYNKDHITYDAIQGLNSTDLTASRFAQLALPRIGEEGMSLDGGRVVEYIFPLNKKANYFFVRSDPSGDADVTSIAYMEIEKDVAVCKWYKKLNGAVSENINPLNNAINKSLGARGVTLEVGTFPTLEDTSFISFTRHSMIQPSPDEDSSEHYKEKFEEMIRILTPQGSLSVPSASIHKTLWSPYAYKHKVGTSDSTGFYEIWQNDILLSQVDENLVINQKPTDLETVHLYGFKLPKNIINGDEQEIDNE